METWQGKHFSITDPEGVNTVIYQINKTPKEYLKEYPKYTVDRLDYTEELRGNMKRKTFYVDFPTHEDELLILSFAKDRVVVNNGFLETKTNIVRVSNTPVPMRFETLYNEQETEFRDFEYTPNLKRPITIIDPDTTDEVKPKLYFDENTNEVKGKCTLQANKTYVMFEITDKKNRN